jgi:TRAP-type C4-dicarboxylate transport system permease small subunit
MKRTLHWLNKFEEITSSVALSAMAVIIILQVFQRYVLQHSLDWPEELARYLFIYSVYVGSSYAAFGRRHLEVTIVRTVFGTKAGKRFTIIAYIITVVFCGLMFVWGVKMVDFVITTNQLAPALQFPMYIAYICLPLGFLLMGLRTIWVIWNLFSENANMQLTE